MPMPSLHYSNLPQFENALTERPSLRTRLQRQGGNVRIGHRCYHVSSPSHRVAYIDALGHHHSNSIAQRLQRLIFRPARTTRHSPSTQHRPQHQPQHQPQALSSSTSTAPLTTTATATTAAATVSAPSSSVSAAQTRPCVIASISRPSLASTGIASAPMASGASAVVSPFSHRPGLRNHGNICYLSSTLQALAYPWRHTGVLTRLLTRSPQEQRRIALGQMPLTPQVRTAAAQLLAQNPLAGEAQGMPHGFDRWFNQQQLLVKVMGKFMIGLGSVPPLANIGQELLGLLCYIGRYAAIARDRALQSMFPLTRTGVIDQSRLGQQDMLEFFSQIIAALGLEADPAICTDVTTQMQSGIVLDRSFVALDQMGQRPEPPQSYLQLPPVGASLQQTIDALFEATVAPQDIPLTDLLPVLPDGSELQVNQRGLTGTPPAVMTLAVPLSVQPKPDLTQLLPGEEPPPDLPPLQLNSLSHSRRVCLPIAIADGTTEVSYQVESVICFRESFGGHYITLLFDGDPADGGTIWVCDDARVCTLAEYFGTNFLMAFSEFSGFRPYLYVLTRTE